MANEQPIAPLILNLLAEEKLAEIKNARDPLKVAVAVTICVLTLSVGTGSLFGLKAERKRMELIELQRKRNKVTAGTTVGDAEELKTTRVFCEEVMAINRNRALFAPQLALIKNIIPDTIQLTRINVGINSEVHAA